jgi:hypothetical protein
MVMDYEEYKRKPHDIWCGSKPCNSSKNYAEVHRVYNPDSGAKPCSTNYKHHAYPMYWGKGLRHCVKKPWYDSTHYNSGTKSIIVNNRVNPGKEDLFLTKCTSPNKTHGYEDLYKNSATCNREIKHLCNPATNNLTNMKRAGCMNYYKNPITFSAVEDWCTKKEGSLVHDRLSHLTREYNKAQAKFLNDLKLSEGNSLHAIMIRTHTLKYSRINRDNLKIQLDILNAKVSTISADTPNWVAMSGTEVNRICACHRGPSFYNSIYEDLKKTYDGPWEQINKEPKCLLKECSVSGSFRPNLPKCSQDAMNFQKCIQSVDLTVGGTPKKIIIKQGCDMLQQKTVVKPNSAGVPIATVSQLTPASAAAEDKKEEEEEEEENEKGKDDKNRIFTDKNIVIKIGIILMVLSVVYFILDYGGDDDDDVNQNQLRMQNTRQPQMQYSRQPQMQYSRQPQMQYL